MPYNGSGTFSAPASSWNPATDGTDIDASDFISLLADVSTALSTCLLKNGTQIPTASLPMGGFKFTGLGAGTAAGNSLRYEQGLQSILTTTGDTIQTTAANTPARLAAQADVAAHATTSNIWGASQITLTGGAVTFTDIADAPYAGAVAWIKQNAAHTWTDGAVFDVQGGANYIAAVGDWIRVYATTVSTFEVTIFPQTRFKVGEFTRDLTTASGTQAVTGVGFQPKAIVFISGIGTTSVVSWGVSDSGTSTGFGDDNVDGAGTYSAGTGGASIIAATAAGAYQEASVTALGADGFTMTWAKVNSPTGTLTVGYLALR